jgi:hypothetical protein
MAFVKKLNSAAGENSILVMNDGAGLCCGDVARSDYATAAIDVSASDVVAVNVTQPGSAAQTVTLDGQPIDWSDAANDAALKAAIGKVATDLGWSWFDGGVELLRAGDNLTITIRDSTLAFNWIGTATSDENAFTATAVV